MLGGQSKTNGVVPKTNSDAISKWFATAEELGEFVGIRFGRIAPGASEPEWIFLSHSEVDGIGGFAQILRGRGAELERLQPIQHFSKPSAVGLLRALPKYLSLRRRIKWGPLEGAPRPSTKTEPPPAVAWHVFDEFETTQIRRVCRKANYTVNSFLLKHLTKAVRPFLEDHSSILPWMVPVNLRGRVTRETDVSNHSSYVSVKVCSYESVHDVHRKIYAALASGEHWANWDAYKTGNVIPMSLRKLMVRADRATAQWNLGGFSNLGVWDSEKKITQAGCLGGWLFAPPVLRCSMLGAGCVTFQNRLGLVVQAHPELTTSAAAPRAWMVNWVKEILTDLDSALAEPMHFETAMMRK